MRDEDVKRIAEAVKQSMLKRPEDMTLDELRPYASEFIRRNRIGKTARPKALKPCRDCGKMLGFMERRKPCPKCGHVNRHLETQDLTL